MKPPRKSIQTEEGSTTDGNSLTFRYQNRSQHKKTVKNQSQEVYTEVEKTRSRTVEEGSFLPH